VDLSLWFERTLTPSWGLFGGGDGSIPAVLMNPGTAAEELLLKVDSMPLTKGARFRVYTGGGGGYGFPWEREPRQVRDDVIDGYVSRTGAAQQYGVVFQGDSCQVDEQGTRQLRVQLATSRALRLETARRVTCR